MTDEAKYDAIGGQVYVDRALAGLNKYRKSVEQFVKEGDKAMKTRILPEVGKQYTHKNTGHHVVVTKIEKIGSQKETIITFEGVEDNVNSFGIYLDLFWANYKVMEGEDD